MAIQLAGLAVVARKHWTALFRGVRGRDVVWMVVFGILNILVSLLVALLVSKLFGTTSNPLVAGLSHLSGPDLVLTFLKTIPQLFGEEVLTMLPFLAILFVFDSQLGFSRKVSIVWAWLISAGFFGAAHLPTYGWNVIQCFVIIGAARPMLTVAYIKTKNLWVSTGAHMVTDWSYFGMSLLLACLSQG